MADGEIGRPLRRLLLLSLPQGGWAGSSTPLVSTESSTPSELLAKLGASRASLLFEYDCPRVFESLKRLDNLIGWNMFVTRE